MIYKELDFSIAGAEGYLKDLLINELGELGFDTFEETPTGFKAFIPASGFSEVDLHELLHQFGSQAEIKYVATDIPHQNWNALWESNFEPLTIADRCYVRATFHEQKPEFEFEIVIDPKMAFGTGHHQTTALVMEMMLEMDFDKKQVLDMGCGTGILGILAKMLGASNVIAIDNDPVCCESAVENSALNQVDMEVILGSSDVIPAGKFDIILANINRNILLEQMPRYSEVLNPGGLIIFSGFYEDPDLGIIKDKASSVRLNFQDHRVLERWTAARFVAL